MSIDQETLDVLTHTAVLAGTFGLAKEAESIIEAVIAVAPDDDNAMILKATTQLNARRFTTAAKTLRDSVLARSPDNTTAKAFLSLAHHLAGNPAERDRYRQEVLDANDDDDAVELVKDLGQH